MQTDNTLVSIISPAYNSAKTIDATIRSVLAQTYPHWEMLIADDGSRDDTVDRVRAYEDDRIRLLINERNMGPAATRNRLIGEAKGRYIAFLDTDDEWLPAKLERQLQLLQQTGDGIGCTGYRRRFPNKTIDLIPPARIRYQDMLKTNHIPMLTAIIDRNIHPHIAFAHKGHEDYQLWLELTRNGDGCSCVQDILAIYNAGNAASVSSNKLRAAGWHWRIMSSEPLPLWRKYYYFFIYMTRGVFKNL